MCEFGDDICILGGYSQENGSLVPQTAMELVDLRNGSVKQGPKSKYGGGNISFVIHNSMVKASKEGVEVYNANFKEWSPLATPESYWFIPSCGWTKVSNEYILVYGGYDDDDNDNGVDCC
jgi:hypothetical protein